ncbi:hypothetical protein LWI29_019443 [Acer saccharum]|uniref:RNase H type-1 domain-containing protein n=1 Tax=Acer saccharum TaxID=4024 RepID=A0AA39SMH8_ACESA|nr:hypothetical protein LWI29_019443 [Acer saccharum]
MRECTEDGEDRDVTSEANLRLNVWLRTVSPPKRFHQRHGRADQRTWKKQVGNLASLSGNFRPRKFDDKWNEKESTVEAMDFSERWRKECQSTTTKQAVGSIDPKQRSMGTDIAFNVVDKENRSGEKIFGEVTSYVGEKQNESSQPQVGSFQPYGPDIVADPTERGGPVQFATQDGPLNKSTNKFSFGAQKTHKSTNWKRIAHGGQKIVEASELKSEKVRSTKIGGKSVEETKEKIEGIDKVRKRDAALEVEDDGVNQKKTKSWSQMETEIAKPEDNVAVSEVSTKLLGMVCSNVQLGTVSKGVTMGMVSPETEILDVSADRPVRTTVINFGFGVDCGWQVSELGIYKANYRARSDVSRRKVGIGIVIRNNLGAIMASCSQIIDASYDERVAGIMAIYRGILFSKDCGLFPCVFESDKHGVVDCIQSGRFLDASYGNIISATADLILADNSMKIRTIPRLANQVA